MIREGTSISFVDVIINYYGYVQCAAALVGSYKSFTLSLLIRVGWLFT